jgi:hypothetical protein
MRNPTTGSGWERYLPLSGAAFTTLTVAAAAAFPMPPGGDVSAASKPAWLGLHDNAIIGQSYLRALAAVAFITLAVAAAGACRRALPEGSSLPSTALIGGAFTGGLLLLSQAVGLSAALFVHAGGSADTTRALAAVQDGFLDLSSLPAVLLFAAVGLTALRTRLLPRWLTVLTLLGVPFAVLDAASYDGGPFEAVGFLGLLYFLAWALLTGVRLYLDQRSAPMATARHPSAMAA